MRSFKDYALEHWDREFPVAPQMFDLYFQNFLTSRSGKAFRNDVGYQELTVDSPGSVGWLRALVALDLDSRNTGTDLEVAFDYWQDWLEPLNSEAPREIGDVFQTSDQWVRMAVELALVRGSIYSILLSVTIVAVALIAFTRNVILSFYMCCCVLATTTCLLGFFVMWGWTLGPFEALILPLVIGLAVDYTLHVGHFYSHDHNPGRKDKVRAALSGIGPSVFAASVSTVGSMLLLLMCKINPFQVFGLSVAATLALGLWVALGPYAAILAIAGPENLQGDIMCCKGCRQKKQYSKMKYVIHETYDSSALLAETELTQADMELLDMDLPVGANDPGNMMQGLYDAPVLAYPDPGPSINNNRNEHLNQSLNTAQRRTILLEDDTKDRDMFSYGRI